MKPIRFPAGFVPPVFNPMPFLPGMEDPEVIEHERMEFIRAAVRKFRRELRASVPKAVKLKPRDELSMEFDFHFSSDFTQLSLAIDDIPDIRGSIDANNYSGMAVDLERPEVHIRKPVLHASEPDPAQPERKSRRGRRKTNPIFTDQEVYWSDAEKLMMKHELLHVSLRALADTGNAEEKADVLVWVFCTNEEEMFTDFSFQNVCACLNMDPDLIRARLIKDFRKFITGDDEIIFTFEKWYDHTFKNGKQTQVLVPVKFSLDLNDPRPLVELETLQPGDAIDFPAALDGQMCERKE